MGDEVRWPWPSPDGTKWFADGIGDGSDVVAGRLTPARSKLVLAALAAKAALAPGAPPGNAPPRWAKARA